METRENECQISQNIYILLMKFFGTLPVFWQVKFDIHFLGLPREIFFGVIKDD